MVMRTLLSWFYDSPSALKPKSGRSEEFEKSLDISSILVLKSEAVMAPELTTSYFRLSSGTSLFLRHIFFVHLATIFLFHKTLTIKPAKIRNKMVMKTITTGDSWSKDTYWIAESVQFSVQIA